MYNVCTLFRMQYGALWLLQALESMTYFFTPLFFMDQSRFWAVNKHNKQKVGILNVNGV